MQALDNETSDWINLHAATRAFADTSVGTHLNAASFRLLSLAPLSQQSLVEVVQTLPFCVCQSGRIVIKSFHRYLQSTSVPTKPTCSLLATPICDVA